MFCPLLGAISVLLLAGIGAELCDEQQIQSILDAHNAGRRQVVPPASNMPVMTWDYDQADQANSWVMQCNFSHNRPGQNMWEGGKVTEVMSSEIYAFIHEAANYDYTSNSCLGGAVCGHYTQVVWAASTVVGCAYNYCPGGKAILVCNYNPYGNYVGALPYATGPPCSQCASGSGWCDNGLCTNNCTQASDNCKCARACMGNCGTFNDTACQCNCQPSWTGNDCSIPTCVNGFYPTGSCSCQCKTGYVGTNCAQSCATAGNQCFKLICKLTTPYWITYRQTQCPKLCPDSPCYVPTVTG